MPACLMHSAFSKLPDKQPHCVKRQFASVHLLPIHKKRGAHRIYNASPAEDIPVAEGQAGFSHDNRSRSPHDASLRIYQATTADARGIASLCSEVFGPLTFRGFPAFMKTSAKLQQQARFEISKDVDTQLRRAMDAKNRARMEAREYRVIRMNNLMQAELQKLAGVQSRSPDAPGAMQRQALKRWQRNRHFICLVATDQQQGGNEAVGCVVLSMAAPEAFLPPPFPSRAALRCCVSNLAVDEGMRRRGVAKKLLRRCEVIARRWGHGELWLHADASNAAAVQLYQAVGYREVKRDSTLFGPFQRILFRKQLAKPKVQEAAKELLPGRSDHGTYLWDVSSK